MNDNIELQRAVFLIRIACYCYLVFAFFWWLAVLPGFDISARLILDISDWPMDRFQDEFDQNTRFLSAIGSGLLVGLSMLLLCVVVPELKRGNDRVVRGAIWGVLAWYVVDSAGCAVLGIYSNVLLNTVYAALIIPPLMLAGRALKKNCNHL